MPISEGLLEALVSRAWEAGNEIMGDVHFQRAGIGRWVSGVIGDKDERQARSMLAFAEEHRTKAAALQGEAV